MQGIEFLKDTCLTVHESKTDESGSEEFFKQGARSDADVIEEHEDGTVDLQFGDGSVAFHVPKACYKEVQL